MLAVPTPMHCWALLPAPFHNLQAAERSSATSMSASNAINWGSVPHRETSGFRPSLTSHSSQPCLRAQGILNRGAARQRPSALSDGAGGAALDAVTASTEAAHEDTGEGRLKALRDLERALDPAAAQAAELRRRHEEAVELARRGDAEAALGRLQTLLVSHHPAVACLSVGSPKRTQQLILPCTRLLAFTIVP